MLELLIKFAIAHPVAVLVTAGLLFFFWATAALISVMPPLPQGSGFWMQWLYNGAQIFGASFDKVITVASRSRFVQELEKKVESADGSILTQKQTTSVSSPTIAPAPPSA